MLINLIQFELIIVCFVVWFICINIFCDPFTSKIQVPNQCKIKIWHPRILCMIHIPFLCLFLWLLVSNEECFLLLLPLLFGWLPNTFRNICMKIAFFIILFQPQIKSPIQSTKTWSYINKMKKKIKRMISIAKMTLPNCLHSKY